MKRGSCLSLALALALLGCRSGSTSSSSSPSASTLESPPANRSVTLLDLPAPPTQVPDAAKEYANGIQDLHEYNPGVAVLHFQKAAQLDPNMAAAHLRASMLMLGGRDPSPKRDEYAKAAALRAQLSHRDQALMDALEPVLKNADEDMPEAVKRLQALSETRPLDAEIFTWLAALQYGLPASLAPSERALELDPKDPQAMATKGAALLAMDKVEDARAAYAQCEAASDENADCTQWEATADSLLGRCEDAERAEERLLKRMPAQALPNLLAAQAAAGRPLDLLRETVEKAKAAAPESARELMGGGLEASLAIFQGDFAGARQLLAAQSQRIAANPASRNAYFFHYLVATMSVGAALESGDVKEAQSVARDVVAESDGWAKDTGPRRGADRYLLFPRLVAGIDKPPGADFEAKQKAWVDADLAAHAYPGIVWTDGYAAPAFTQKEAVDALAKLGDFTPLTSITFGPLDPLSLDGDIGHVYLLAGKPNEALPYLARADATCNVFWTPFVHMRAVLDLGIALEAHGDKAGACAAYTRVLDRWGSAKPRSATADRARERSKALKCGG